MRSSLLSGLCACALSGFALVFAAARGSQQPAQSPSSQPASQPHSQPTAPAPERHSIFIWPLFLDAKPPELRSLEHLVIPFDIGNGAPLGRGRTPEQARELAEQFRERVLAGESYDALCQEWIARGYSRLPVVLGSVAQGMLPEVDDFLFSAEIGAISTPRQLRAGIALERRVETYAACRQIMVQGTDANALALAQELRAKLDQGADFAELARESSQDPLSAPLGGQLAIFERGPRDQILKAEAFRLALGEIGGPIGSPIGYHIVKRVPLEEIDPSLADRTWVRARAILLAHAGVLGGTPRNPRSAESARKLGAELHQRILEGADMAELAREHCDDIGGRERGGDLGWVHRRAPSKLASLDALYSAVVGELLDIQETTAGIVLLRREG